ncbi:LysR family transcriptional regulator, partial [Klebsiella pneumoniae]|nr:LysR family transcriptional regulator [Klebsiella pneumoniae]
AGLVYSIVPRMAVERVEDRDGLLVHSLAPLLYRHLAVVMRQDKILTKGIAEILRLMHTVRL